MVINRNVGLLFLFIVVFLHGCSTVKLSENDEQLFIDYVYEIQAILSDPGLNIRGGVSINYIYPCKISVEAISNNGKKGLIYHRSKASINLSKNYRDIEYVPEHVVRHEGGELRKQDSITISFNRDLNVLIENQNIDTNRTSVMMEYYNVSIPIKLPFDSMLFEKFVNRFKAMATLCGADINRVSTAIGKLQGVWAIWGRGQYMGEFTFKDNSIEYRRDYNNILFTQQFQLKKVDSEYFILLNSGVAPDDMKIMKVNFFSSNRAELYLLGSDKTQIGSSNEDDALLYQLTRLSD